MLKCPVNPSRGSQYLSSSPTGPLEPCGPRGDRERGPLLVQTELQKEVYLNRVASVQAWVPSALLVQKLHINKTERKHKTCNDISKFKLSLMDIEFQFRKIKFQGLVAQQCDILNTTEPYT